LTSHFIFHFIPAPHPLRLASAVPRAVLHWELLELWRLGLLQERGCMQPILLVSENPVVTRLLATF